MKKILFIDDDSAMRNLISGFLEDICEVIEAETDEEGIVMVMQHRPSLVLTDLVMPGISGLDLLLHVKNLCPQTGVIVMTAYPTPEFKKETLKKEKEYLRLDSEEVKQANNIFT